LLAQGKPDELNVSEAKSTLTHKYTQAALENQVAGMK
jgi:hypothetical protein